MLKAILFDFDGTIVDSLKHHLYAWRKTFSQTGTDLNDEEIIENVFYQSGGENNPKFKINDKRLDLYNQNIEEAFKNLELHQNLIQVLERLQKLKIKMCIISFAESKIIISHLKNLKIEHYFEFVLGNDDVQKGKPNPEIANKAMEKLEIRPHETLLVGDTNWDILTGKNAGTMTALFIPETNLSFINVDRYRETNPDFEFSDFSDFLDRIEKLS